MQVLILPGFSQKNKRWAQDLSRFLSPQFEAIFHSWKHWESSKNAVFSPESELKLIRTQLESNQVSHVIAKSIGTYVLALGLPELQPFIKKILLCGVPVNDLSVEERGIYKNYRSHPKSDIICFQNNLDSHGSAADLMSLFELTKLDIPLRTFEADTHDYPYYKEIVNFLS